MSMRRECREWVVQLLFQLDLNPSNELDDVFARFWTGKPADARARAFTEDVVKGVRTQLAEIDRTIAGLAEHWDLHRMGVLDRNVIRMAVYEMLHRNDIPPVVSINEAVDIAKYFSSRESGRFVNGILDSVRRGLKRPARKAVDTGDAEN
jgi:N utilization substance protein B